MHASAERSISWGRKPCFAQSSWGPVFRFKALLFARLATDALLYQLEIRILPVSLSRPLPDLSAPLRDFNLFSKIQKGAQAFAKAPFSVSFRFRIIRGYARLTHARRFRSRRLHARHRSSQTPYRIPDPTALRQPRP